MEGTVSLAFKVRNRLGTGIENAQAFADISPTAGITAFADSDGLLTLELPHDVPRFDCQIMAAGYSLKTVEIATASPPKEVVLDEAHVLRGRVLSESGKSLAGAAVSVSTVQVARQSGEHSFPIGDVTTDSTGHFLLALMADSNLELSITCKGYLPAIIWLDKVGEQTDVRAVLKKPEAALHGFVVDPRGQPIRDFTISVTPANLDLSRASASMLENAKLGDIGAHKRFQAPDGSFSFPELRAGRFRITGIARIGKVASLPGSGIEPPEVLRGEQEIELRRGVDTELTLRLAPYVRPD